jgi:hypothetical protein
VVKRKQLLVFLSSKSAIYNVTVYTFERQCIRYQNIPNGQKIWQHLSLLDTPKFTQIWIFGLKIYRLATLGLGV